MTTATDELTINVRAGFGDDGYYFEARGRHDPTDFVRAAFHRHGVVIPVAVVKVRRMILTGTLPDEIDAELYAGPADSDYTDLDMFTRGDPWWSTWADGYDFGKAQGEERYCAHIYPGGPMCNQPPHAADFGASPDQAHEFKPGGLGP